jgi:hypothetical protein
MSRADLAVASRRWLRAEMYDSGGYGTVTGGRALPATPEPPPGAVHDTALLKDPADEVAAAPPVETGPEAATACDAEVDLDGDVDAGVSKTNDGALDDGHVADPPPPTDNGCR